MPNSTDKGNQIQQIRPNRQIRTQALNSLFYQIIPDGIYAGATLTKVSNNTLSVSPGVVFINDDTAKTAIRIETTSDWSMTNEASPTKPYIVFTYEWSDDPDNYMDIVAKNSGDLLSKDLIVGKVIFSGSNIDTFDYNERSVAKLAFDFPPVGFLYTQYATADSNNLAVAFPSEESPASLFGGTWQLLWDNEGIDFHTEGYNGEPRVGGLQNDHLQEFWGNVGWFGMAYQGNGTGILRIGGPYPTFQNDVIGSSNSGDLRYLYMRLGYQSIRRGPRTSDRNRLMRIWRKTG